ncbi:MAG: hypothetical protein ACRCT8_02790 [Lacipirellulaceae bacterium]
MPDAVLSKTDRQDDPDRPVEPGFVPVLTSDLAIASETIQLDFERERTIVFLEDLFPSLGWPKIEASQLRVLGLSGTDKTTSTKDASDPSSGPTDTLLRMGESVTHWFTQATHVGIQTLLELRTRDGDDKPALVVRGVVKDRQGNAAALNFAAIRRERRLWRSYPRLRAPKPQPSPYANVLSMMSNDALAIYAVDPRAQAIELNNRLAAEAAVNAERARRAQVSLAMLDALGLLDGWITSLHGTACVRVAVLQPDLRNVTTTPHGLR